jgi:hypothetical protein
MRRITLASICFFLSLVTLPARAAAQEQTRTEFWPEVDVYLNLKPKLRIFAMGTVGKSVEDGELLTGDAFEGQVGVHLDYLVNKHIGFRAGYRYSTSIGGAPEDSFKEHRLLTEQTLRKSIPCHIDLTDRNRQEFRFINGDFSFRYRNRLRLEREFTIGKRTITPYWSVEVSFDTRYDVWNKTRFASGVEIPLKRTPLKLLLKKHETILDIYYLRQHDTRSSTTFVNGLGAIMAFYL